MTPPTSYLVTIVATATVGFGLALMLRLRTRRPSWLITLTVLVLTWPLPIATNVIIQTATTLLNPASRDRTSLANPDLYQETMGSLHLVSFTWGIGLALTVVLWLRTADSAPTASPPEPTHSDPPPTGVAGTTHVERSDHSWPNGF